MAGAVCFSSMPGMGRGSAKQASASVPVRAAVTDVALVDDCHAEAAQGEFPRAADSHDPTADNENVGARGPLGVSHF